MGILIGVFIVAIITDLKYYKIPNPLILIGMVSGLVYSTCRYSYQTALASIACMAIVFVCLYPFYLLGGLGAGDIKLFMMTGCFIRNNSLLNYMLVTLIIAAFISIGKMIAFKESRQRLLYLGRYAKKVALTGAIDEYEVDKSDKRTIIRMALPAFISLILMCMGVYS